MSFRLLAATRNRGKLAEIAAALADLKKLTLVRLDSFPDVAEVMEDGETFEANALKKARQVAAATGMATLADDSGLEVAALGGAPGVYSARFAGAAADDEANNRKLLAQMAGVADGGRQAAFRCVLALCLPGGECRTCQGELRGTIGREPRGSHGFGYDPLFVPEGQTRTISELGVEVKARISHRARALAELRRILPEFFLKAAPK
ncbi:MAG: XTP/dITP diphosphatase [Pseudomonadota bacterium]